MSRTIVDIHVLQTVPPSNLNRDDTGSPKTARFGGVVRARVSSQAWKRATRKAFEDQLDRKELGMRTKRLVEVLGDAIVELDASLADKAPELAKNVFTALGFKLAPPRNNKNAPEESSYLVFLSARQITALAELAVQSVADDSPIDKATAKRIAKSDHSIDVALFGRMIADDSDLNVDASAQVAHAISVHGVQNEFDYFTAVDDHKNADAEEDAGASMIGTVEFNSSTLYRYATVDVDRLLDNLGDATATQRAVEAFARAFVLSMPTGKQNTFANRTLPDAALIVVRETQSINLVGAFEEEVTRQPRIAEAIDRLAQHTKEIHDAYAETPIAAWTFGPGVALAPLEAIAERGNVDVALAALGTRVSERLA